MIEGMSTTTLEQYPYVQDLRFQMYCTPVVWLETIWRLPHGVTLEAATNENVHEIKKSGGSMRWQPIHLLLCVFESDTDTYIYMNLDDVLRMCIQLL